MTDRMMPEEGAEGSEEREPARRRTAAVILTAILLLLLLLCGCGTYTTGAYRSAFERATFVVQNRGCISCHLEELPAVASTSVHRPFLKHQCTSCHNRHVVVARVTVTSRSTSAIVSTQALLRWGPLRNLFDQVERLVFGAKDKDQDTARYRLLGKATLVATPRSLCWTCHPGLAEDRMSEFPHQPFAMSNCISCHDPHASDYEQLLVNASEDLCMMCHPMGTQLNRTYAHPPAKKLHCLECHEAHGSDYQGILVASQRDLCFACHPDVAGDSLDSVQHEPFEGDSCTSCHEPHGSDYQPLLVAETPGLCYDCHTAIEPRLQRTSHHPVGTQIDCTSCHSPHASNQSGLLVLSERQLCLGCHSDIDELAVLSVQHSPFQDEPCTSCHTPHGSDYTPLLRNPTPNLCYGCHPELGVAMQRASHHPDTCTKCHRVHASSYEKLLVAESGNGFCYRCHASVAVHYVQSKHNVVDCLQCHRPHGSRFGALRRHAPTALCSSCHPAEDHVRFVGDGNIAHRGTPHFYDVNAAKPLTCTSSCHNPHGTQFQYMTRIFEWRQDGLCLQCHTYVGKTF